MASSEINIGDLPGAYRDGFETFAHVLLELAGEDLIGLAAFGGWVIEDAFFAGTPARSVAVLRRVDLKMLDRLACSGARFGKHNIGAPLMMTPEYIEASCDVFPLELLEIRQLQALVYGEDHFSKLTFQRNDLRLQSERELKSELIRLRQGLLAAAGRHKLLTELCLGCTERAVRILRGLLHLADPARVVKPAWEVVKTAAEITGVSLDALERLIARSSQPGLVEFEGLYGEVEALAAYADSLGDSVSTDRA